MTQPPSSNHVMQCMEVWGGNVGVESGISVHGIDAWIFSHPFRGDREGGDIHYVSMCGAGRIARFILADVAGHGNEVSALAALLRRLMRRHIGTPDQTRLARSLNRAFGRLSQHGIFATAAMLTYFAPTDQLITCLAGHPRPLWFRASTGRWQLLSHEQAETRLSLDNLPLGIIYPTDYYQFAVDLEAGDLVVLYTDALIETGGPRGKQIGEEGLLHMAARMDRTDLAEFGRSLIAGVDRELGVSHVTRTDDLTLLVLHHNAANPPPTSLTHKLRMMAKMLGL